MHIAYSQLLATIIIFTEGYGKHGALNGLIRVSGGDVPVAIPHPVVEVDVERTVIGTVVGIPADKGEAAP